MPIPVFRWARGQRLDQSLLEVQCPEYERVLAHAPACAAVMITSGDVLLRLPKELPPMPDVDVLGLGMLVTPEKAKDFGVFFSPRQHPNELAFFLQKPDAAKIRQLLGDYVHLIDTGMWLLSERAVNVLLKKCGWDEKKEAFLKRPLTPALSEKPSPRPSPIGWERGRGKRRPQAESLPAFYELYAEFGLSLGTTPTKRDPLVNALSCAVVALPEAQFYHFGASRQMIESITAIQNLELDETKLGLMGAKAASERLFAEHTLRVSAGLDENHTTWVENAAVPKSWHIAHEHVLTGVPENQWHLRLEPGVCLDFVPIGKHDFCVRAYGITDAFSGAVGDANTRWLGQPVAEWFKRRGIDFAQAGIQPGTDIQLAPLFPVLPFHKPLMNPPKGNPLTPTLSPKGEREMRSRHAESQFLEWLFAAAPAPNEDFARRWLGARRLSAQEICETANLRRIYEQRAKFRHGCLLPMFRNHRWSVFLKLDLESTAAAFARSGQALPKLTFDPNAGLEPLQQVHEQMFRSAVLRHRRQRGWERFEANAFARLREHRARRADCRRVAGRCVQEDQIVWARSPVRLDLAGGWTDTPPYCLEYGGKVLNLAVDLNGQPPIRVFAKLSPKPELVMRSIDLGVERRVSTYEELDTFANPGSEFALAKPAFALTGFLPRFHAHGGSKSLRQQLEEFGAGIEISMVSAIPKGSGLGTSSILAATLLATLGDLCGLNWDRNMLSARTLALEQLLTTGGGWQDQAGAIFRGVKLIETTAGLVQKPVLRWLPGHLFEHEYANRTIFLYYTGITRLAKNILQEIVRGIFLNSPAISTVEAIGANAERACNALQQCDYRALAEAIGTVAVESAVGFGHQSASRAAHPASGGRPVGRGQITGRAAGDICCCWPKTAGGRAIGQRIVRASAQCPGPFRAIQSVRDRAANHAQLTVAKSVLRVGRSNAGKKDGDAKLSSG